MSGLTDRVDEWSPERWAHLLEQFQRGDDLFVGVLVQVRQPFFNELHVRLPHCPHSTTSVLYNARVVLTPSIDHRRVADRVALGSERRIQKAGPRGPHSDSRVTKGQMTNECSGLDVRSAIECWSQERNRCSLIAILSLTA